MSEIILSDLIEKINNFSGDNKIAVFDMDGTLFKGDIAELTNALAADRNIIQFDYQDYLTTRKNDIHKAYRDIIKIWEGRSKKQVHSCVNEAKALNKSINFQLEKIKPITIRNSTQQIISELNKNEFDIYLVSASQQEICEALIENTFDIKMENIYGVKLKINNNLFSNDIIEPAPILEGKKEVVNKFIKTKPAFIFGDSINDKWLFESGSSDSLSIVLNNELNYKKIKDLVQTKNIFRLINIDKNEAIDKANKVFDLFKNFGNSNYIGESISQAEHSLQAGDLALNEEYSEEVILGAFFHDIGHLLGEKKGLSKMEKYGISAHEGIGAKFLKDIGIKGVIIDLISLHVNAKRYLCLKNESYFNSLSEASKETLKHQGGVMSKKEAKIFEDHENFELIIKSRNWDEKAKLIDYKTNSLDFYYSMFIDYLLDN